MRTHGCLGQRLWRDADSPMGSVDALLSRAKACHVDVSAADYKTPRALPPLSFFLVTQASRQTPAYVVSIRRPRTLSLFNVFFASSVFSSRGSRRSKESLERLRSSHMVLL